MEEKEFDYINVIPFVDIMLVLLTIVLMTSTFIATGGINVELPRASKNRADVLKTQTIEIDKKGNIFFNTSPVSIDQLKESLKRFQRDIPILIRADKSISLQIFVDVLDCVKSLEFKKVSLQTEEIH